MVGAVLLAALAFAMHPVRGYGLNLVVVLVGSIVLFALVVGRLSGLVREVEASTHLVREQREEIVAEQRLVTELRRVNQLRGEIVAIASHELRTPLTSIIGYTKTLQRPEFAGDPARRDEFLATIARQGDRLSRLVDNLLTASHLENGEVLPVMEEINLGSLFDGLVEALGPKAERVTVLTPPDLPPIKSDRQLLDRAIANLLDNALKYSPETTTCELGARVEGQTMLVWVADAGTGIQDKHLERIFDRFYRVDRSPAPAHSGIGLGLSLVRDMVQALGGTVEVVSRFGYGSTFTLHLPLHGVGQSTLMVGAPALRDSESAIS